MKSYRSFTDAYYYELQSLIEQPEYVCSPRGLKIKENLGVSFKITNPTDRIPQLKCRNYNSSYFIAESLFYLSGIERTSWISYYSKFWDQISENGIANSAYGARIFKKHQRTAPPEISEDWSQWKYVINELVKDQDSRRAVIHIRSPWDSVYSHLDVPCTLSFQFFIRDDKLHMVASMRSNDAWLGLGNDVPAFTLLQEVLALELSRALGKHIKLGDYIHQANSFHIYERHFELARELLENRVNQAYVGAGLSEPMPKMPSLPNVDVLMQAENNIRNAVTDDDLFRTINSFQGYYRDWVTLLAIHRSKKLENELEDYLEQSLSYRGYCYR